MKKEYDVVCIGMINMNLPVKPVDKSVFDVDVTLVDPIKAYPGGDAMNESITLARLGNRVALAGKVGDDDFGKLVLNIAGEAGVDTAYVKISPDDSTSVCIMLINSSGSRNFASYRGANETFRLEDLDTSLLEKTKIVNIGSMFALKLLDGPGVTALLKKARSAGAVTGSDMKFDTYGIGFEGIKSAMPYIDYFMPSYDEAVYLTGEKEPSRMADVLLAAGAGAVVIKLGENGCYIAAEGKRYNIPPCPAVPVDTTGAGDSFVAGFLTGVARGWDIESCGWFANAVGSLTIGTVGPTGAVKSLRQVLDHMKAVNYFKADKIMHLK